MATALTHGKDVLTVSNSQVVNLESADEIEVVYDPE